MKFLISVIVLLANVLAVSAEDVTGKITGFVRDAISAEPLEYAIVSADNRNVYTDSLGFFTIDKLPVGRHDVKVSYMGYSPVSISDLMVGSAHTTPLEVTMQPLGNEIAEVVVTVDNRRPVNSMALGSGVKLNMSEASRYAGSIDDPARLASAVAGVATGGAFNGISIHGVAPHLMQWRLEGVEIPNPNHFADLSTLGGGILSSLSSFVLGNSDFYAGSSPAQYANTISGVFDMNMRNGNNREFQHAFQAGALGFNFASEGPIGKKGGASYVVNYRYSFTGLLEDLDIMDAGGKFRYQDLNFKINLPTKNSGDFSLWSTSFIDKFAGNVKGSVEEEIDWEYADDGSTYTTRQWTIAGGVNHKISLGRGRLTSGLAVMHSNSGVEADMTPYGTKNFSNYIDNDKKLTDLTATMNYLFSVNNAWTMRLGANFTEKIYNLSMKKAPAIGEPLVQITDGEGNTELMSVYSDNVFNISDRVKLGAGVNLMYLALNESFTVNPRLSAEWKASDRFTLSAATGLYSRMESMDVYFSKPITITNTDYKTNRDLGFTKSFQGSFSASYNLGYGFRLTASPFVHYLYDVPCGADNSFSVFNRIDFYCDRYLVNKGKGLTYGADIALDRSLSNGYYSKLVTSLFNSRYTGGDGVWHNTRFDRGYILNLICGKEWTVGRRRNNILCVNGRLTYQGGERHSPIDVAATEAHPDFEVQYDETRAFEEQFDPMFLFSFSASYRVNRKNVSHIFAADVLNVAGSEDPLYHSYNMRTQKVDIILQNTFMPNIYYRLEF